MVLLEVLVSYFSGASSTLMYGTWMSRCKSSPGSSVMRDCAVRSLNATFVVVPFLISSAHISPRGCLATRIFSSRLHFVLIVSALVFLCGQLGGKPHSSGPPLSLKVPCDYGLLIFQPEGYRTLKPYSLS